MIRRVFVSGYKSLNDVELHLERLTVVLGPNAVGKSNLFDALKLLSRMVTSRSLIEAFEEHRGDPLEAFDYSRDGIEGLLRKESIAFTIEVDVELSGGVVSHVEEQIRTYRSGLAEGGRAKVSRRVTERFLRYRLSVEMLPKSGVLRVKDEELLALKKERNGQLSPDEKRRPFIEHVHDRLRLRMEGQARPTEHELGLNYTLVSQSLYPPHYPHIIAFREEVSRWRFYYFEPRLMREESALKESMDLTSQGADLAVVYHTLQNRNSRQFENLQKTLSSLVPGVEGLGVEVTQEGKLRLKVKEGGTDFSAKVISEGTLRLLGLLAILHISPATVVGFEEPENGVHPRRLKLIADLLRNASEEKQIVANTHSPLLPDYLSDAYLVRCTKRNGWTVFEPLKTESATLFRPVEVEEALKEPLKEPTPISQRTIRGDFDE